MNANNPKSNNGDDLVSMSWYFRVHKFLLLSHSHIIERLTPEHVTITLSYWGPKCKPFLFSLIFLFRASCETSCANKALSFPAKEHSWTHVPLWWLSRTKGPPKNKWKHGLAITIMPHGLLKKPRAFDTIFTRQKNGILRAYHFKLQLSWQTHILREASALRTLHASSHLAGKTPSDLLPQAGVGLRTPGSDNLEMLKQAHNLIRIP